MSGSGGEAPSGAWPKDDCNEHFRVVKYHIPPGKRNDEEVTLLEVLSGRRRPTGCRLPVDFFFGVLPACRFEALIEALGDMCGSNLR